MKNCKRLLGMISTICVVAWCGPVSRAQSKDAPPSTTQVHVVITDAALRADAELPPFDKEDLKVKQGKNFLDITQLIPAQGENAALQLMILIDDTLDTTSVGNNLQDIKDFIRAQPPSTVIAVGYMSNTTVQVEQNFTPDHELAANAIRLPRGSLGSMDSSFLSLISLVKSWPQQKIRREVIMVADGIDRLHGETPEPARMGRDFGTVYHSMPTISNDASSASEVAQRYNVIVFPIYSPGIGRAGRSSWDRNLGLSALTKIADETGGECFSLSTSNAVSFKPYMERIQKLLNNQYYLVFNATQDKKDRLVRINIRKVVEDKSEILAPDNVWVAGPPKAAKEKGD